MTTCDVVAERVALGEPLGDAAEHAERCPKCRALVALPVELGQAKRAADPGLGFSARMTAGAQHRFTVRRRRRIAAGIAAVVVAMGLGVVFVTHEPAHSDIAAIQPLPIPPTAAGHDKDNQPDPWKQHEDGGADDDVRALVQLADTDRASHASAPWKHIEKQLGPYRSLLQGVEP